MKIFKITCLPSEQTTGSVIISTVTGQSKDWKAPKFLSGIILCREEKQRREMSVETFEK